MQPRLSTAMTVACGQVSVGGHFLPLASRFACMFNGAPRGVRVSTQDSPNHPRALLIQPLAISEFIMSYPAGLSLLLHSLDNEHELCIPINGI